MKPYRYRTQAGFGIVEVMVVLVISLLLLAGLYNVFFASKSSYRLNEASSRVQENGRFAAEYLGKDVRMVGYFGCVNAKKMAFHNNVCGGVVTCNSGGAGKDKFNANVEDIVTFDGSDSLVGFDNVVDIDDAANQLLKDLGMVVGTNDGDIASGTDVIFVKSAGTCDGGNVVFTGLGQTYRYKDTANVKIEDATSCKLEQGSLVMLSDCATVDLFAISSTPTGGAGQDTLTHGSNFNIEPRLQGAYGPGSEIYALNAKVIYIGTNTVGNRALYINSFNTSSSTMSKAELVEGVTDMQVLYGEDTDGDGSPNYYATAVNVTDMADVVALRVSYLVTSLDDNVTDNPQRYTFNGVTVTPTDNRLRRVFTSTYALRNRLLN